MSIKDRLTKKTEGLLNPVPEDRNQSDKSQQPPKTGPGQMLAFRAQMLENGALVEDLELRLKEFEGSARCLLIDPTVIKPSKWANRHEISFGTSEFEQLKKEIEVVKGNIQPIKVRPIQGRAGEYELIFGHRRHRACLDIGLKVLAIVEDRSDRDLFREMEVENREQNSPSAWEQGVKYRKGLESGLYASLRQMAVDIGVDPGNASKAIAVANLPEEVIQAFPSALSIQYNWGPKLSERLQNDPEGVLREAKRLTGDNVANGKLSAKQVFDRLMAVSARATVTRLVSRNGKPWAVISARGGKVTVEFKKQEKVEKQIEDLERWLKTLTHA